VNTGAWALGAREMEKPGLRNAREKRWNRAGRLGRIGGEVDLDQYVPRDGPE